jgi:hypothetical protein
MSTSPPPHDPCFQYQSSYFVLGFNTYIPVPFLEVNMDDHTKASLIAAAASIYAARIQENALYASQGKELAPKRDISLDGAMKEVQAFFVRMK